MSKEENLETQNINNINVDLPINDTPVSETDKPNIGFGSNFKIDQDLLDDINIKNNNENNNQDSLKTSPKKNVNPIKEDGSQKTAEEIKEEQDKIDEEERLARFYNQFVINHSDVHNKINQLKERISTNSSIKEKIDADMKEKELSRSSVGGGGGKAGILSAIAKAYQNRNNPKISKEERKKIISSNSPEYKRKVAEIPFKTAKIYACHEAINNHLSNENVSDFLKELNPNDDIYEKINNIADENKRKEISNGVESIMKYREDMVNINKDISDDMRFLNDFGNLDDTSKKELSSIISDNNDLSKNIMDKVEIKTLDSANPEEANKLKEKMNEVMKNIEEFIKKFTSKLGLSM